jgi:hypothetical protein
MLKSAPFRQGILILVMTTPKDIALSACRLLMEPIVAILLRNGITYKDMLLLCKQIFVKVALEEYGIRGRETNQSRISMITGIDRKEVARVKESLGNSDASDQAQHQQDRLTRVISGWYQSPDFTDAQGNPLALEAEGERASFALLVKQFGGDMPASAILKELKRTQVIEEDSAGLLHLVKRHFTPSPSDPAALLRASSVINDLASALHHNLYKATGSKSLPLKFERRATNTRVPEALAPAFHVFLEQEGQAFLERVDAWLTEHEQPHNPSADASQPQTDTVPSLRLGVGAYLIEGRVAPAPTSPSNAVNSTEETRGDSSNDHEVF